MKRSDWYLIISGGIGLLLAALSSSDLRQANTAEEGFLFQDVVQSLGAGYAISILIYFLVVRIPEAQKRRRLKENLLRHYAIFRKDIIGDIVNLSGTDVSSDEIEIILTPRNFRNYFRIDETGSGRRWYDFLNELKEHDIDVIRTHLRIFRDEIQSTLMQLDSPSEESYLFLKNLSLSIHQIGSVPADYDGAKSWGLYLWGILASYTFSEGYLDHDLVENAVKNL